ncbi:MAG: methyltransferase family protein [Brevefilum sp.]
MSEKEKVLTLRVLLILLVFIVGVPMLPLLISWDWAWWEAWTYAGVNFLGFVISRVLASRKHPDLIVERGKFFRHDNPEVWDKTLSPLVGLAGGLIPLVAGLDARFGISISFPLWVRLAALGLLIAGYVLGSYALITNRYFSGMVRIQSDRGHQVVNSGPYRWMRHPGYAGSLLSYLATPFLLESLWTFTPVVLISAILVLRTALEDRTLQKKLEGYREYTNEVHYRLIPGIW